ncbi:hypothetical protein MTO96_033699 [Rhipicephalus appendiculatus]
MQKPGQERGRRGWAGGHRRVRSAGWRLRTPCAWPVALCGCHEPRNDDATVPQCPRAPGRSSYHEYLRRALLREQDKQVIMLPGARVRRNGMIVDVSRTSLLPNTSLHGNARHRTLVTQCLSR